MKKPVPIRRFGTAGLVTDIPPVERTWEQLSRADNVRMEDGALATFSAFEKKVNIRPGATYAHPFYLSDESGGHVVFFADGTITYYGSNADVDGTDARDITPVFYEPTPGGVWTCVQTNDILVATNGGIPLQITEQDLLIGGKMELMPNWPPGYTAGLVSAMGNFLVLADITVDGFPQRSTVMWSHPLAPGDTEFFFYDRTDPTASLQLLAGENVLTSAGRDIVGLQPLRESMIVYMDHSTWRMSFVGGQFVMSFGQMFNQDGAVGPRAFADINGRAVVCGYRDLYVHDGASLQHIGDGVITRYLYRNVPSVQHAFVAQYPEREETYFFFRAVDDIEAREAYVYRNGAFTHLLTPAGVACAYVGPSFGRRTLTYAQAMTAGTLYSTTADTYHSVTTAATGRMLIGLCPSQGGLYYLDPPNAAAAAHRPDLVVIEFDRADADNLFGTVGDHVKTVSRLYPQVGSNDKGGAVLVFDVGVAATSRGPLIYERSIEFDPAADIAVDTRQSGRYFSLRVRLRPGETRHMYLTGMDAEIFSSGRQ